MASRIPRLNPYIHGKERERNTVAVVTLALLPPPRVAGHSRRAAVLAVCEVGSEFRAGQQHARQNSLSPLSSTPAKSWTFIRRRTCGGLCRRALTATSSSATRRPLPTTHRLIPTCERLAIVLQNLWSSPSSHRQPPKQTGPGQESTASRISSWVATLRARRPPR